MTSRIGRWVEDTFGVEIYKWYARDEWVKIDTDIVHDVVEEHESSVDVKTYWAYEYQHKDFGSSKRRVGGSRGYHSTTLFHDREYVENNTLDFDSGFGSFGSYPKEKYLDFKTEYDHKVVLGEENEA